MDKKHIMILMLLGIGLTSLVVKFDQVKAGYGYGTGEPAGMASNMTGNMTGNTTDLVEQGMLSADPAGITSGRGPQDKFLTDEPEPNG